MRDKLLAGAPADLLILTRALIAELTRARATWWPVPPSTSARCARASRCAAAILCLPSATQTGLRAALLGSGRDLFP